MTSDKGSRVILGEASESDEDDVQPVSPSAHQNEKPKLIVPGEASESDAELDDTYNVTAEAFKSKAEEVQFNSLLHKKLRESNCKLKEDMKELVSTSLRFVTEQVNDINQRLLTNQIEIQDTFKYLRRSTVSSEKLDNLLSCVLTQNYLPSINIK